MTESPRSVARLVPGTSAAPAKGFDVVQVHRRHLPQQFDPLLAIDHFRMARPFFPPHPHAGFSAVTYMLSTSANGFVNRDSLGDTVRIHPGDLHWTAAGSGMLHEETPIPGGGVCEGLQIFVDLPLSAKWMQPRVLHLGAADVPRRRQHGVDVRVVLGEHDQLVSPLAPPTALTLLEVSLQAGSVFRHAAPRTETRLVYVLAGRLRLGDGDAVRIANAHEAVGFANDGDHLELTALEPARFVLAGGPPLGQPARWRGPFCMANEADLERAFADFHAGRMGTLQPSF